MTARGATSPDISTPVEEKLQIEHEEAVAPVDPYKGGLKSTFDGLTYWQTVKTFKLVSFYCAIAAFSAATDGYQARPLSPFRQRKYANDCVSP
jgi:hypothetical protein